jgi:electron transfer flavoprotein beta subunit
MKLLVVVEVGADLRIPPQREPRSGRVREEWLVAELEPASVRALEIALSLKAVQPGAEIAVLHLGPADNERWLRWSIARGCDRAVRVWDDEVADAKGAGKAVILAAAARALGFDLLLSGTAGVLDASGQLGVLLAESLETPCVTQVIDIAVAETAARQGGTGEGNAAADEGAGSPGRAVLTRALYGGFRERAEGVLPLVVAAHPDESGGGPLTGPIVSASALLTAHEQQIPVWNLADLGVPSERVREADQALQMGEPRPVRPRLHSLKAPDPALPAFERVLMLVEGAVQRRAGEVIQKPAEEIVDEIFQNLKDEGWLDHLRSTAIQ